MIILNNPILIEKAMTHVAVNPSENPSYLSMMTVAKQNLMVSLTRLEAEDPFFQLLRQEKKEAFHNLTLTSASAGVRTDLPCFDDFWIMIKKVFDQTRDAVNSKELSQCTQDFKKVILFLIEAGIPFVDGKEVSFWSTRFARNVSAQYAERNKTVIDTLMAQSRVKKIFLKWPSDEILVFHDALKTPVPAYPELSQVYWNAVSAVYADQIKQGGRAHVFFQDSLTVGNYFWNAELPVVRQKQAELILHRYDTKAKTWSETRMDSAGLDAIPLQRRNVHPTDPVTPTRREKTQHEAGALIWKQTFESSDPSKPLVAWSAPKTLTIGKMRRLCHLFKEKTLGSTSASDASAPKSVSDKTL